MFFINRYNKILNYFCIVNDVFSHEEVDKIIDLEDLQKFQKGAVGSGGVDSANVKKETRDSEIMWLSHDANSEWLYQKFGSLVSHVNYDHFMYDIDGFDAFQYTVYHGNENQHYDWHCDYANQYLPVERKISASVMLTDPNDYGGGEFEIVVNGQVQNIVSVKPKKGDVVFFASWMPHRVAPVTSGIRKSLVCWVSGKRSS